MLILIWFSLILRFRLVYGSTMSPEVPRLLQHRPKKRNVHTTLKSTLLPYSWDVASHTFSFASGSSLSHQVVMLFPPAFLGFFYVAFHVLKFQLKISIVPLQSHSATPVELCNWWDKTTITNLPMFPPKKHAYTAVTFSFPHPLPFHPSVIRGKLR